MTKHDENTVWPSSWPHTCRFCFPLALLLVSSIYIGCCLDSLLHYYCAHGTSYINVDTYIPSSRVHPKDYFNLITSVLKIRYMMGPGAGSFWQGQRLLHVYIPLLLYVESYKQHGQTILITYFSVTELTFNLNVLYFDFILHRYLTDL